MDGVYLQLLIGTQLRAIRSSCAETVGSMNRAPASYCMRAPS